MANQDTIAKMSEAQQQQRVAPRSGRGTQLTPSQETTLINICMSSRGEDRLSNHTKSFWKSLSAELFQSTGRVYSWQSCRRRMVAWELNQFPAEGVNDDRLEDSVENLSSDRPRCSPRVSEGPLDSVNRLGIPSDDVDSALVTARRDLSSSRGGDLGLISRGKPPNDDRRRGSPSTRRETRKTPFNDPGLAHRHVFADEHPQTNLTPTNDESADDDELVLPDTPIPLLQRNIHARCEREKAALRGEFLPMFLNSMSAFEAQIQYFTSAFFDDKTDREGILGAFDDLKERVRIAIDRQKGSVDSSRR